MFFMLGIIAFGLYWSYTRPPYVPPIWYWRPPRQMNALHYGFLYLASLLFAGIMGADLTPFFGLVQLLLTDFIMYILYSRTWFQEK